MKLAWALAALVLLAGCGSGHDDTPKDHAGSPKGSVKSLPKFDAATKDDAQVVLDSALHKVVSEGLISFKTGFELSGTTLSFHGSVDFPHKASNFSLDVGGPAVGQDSGSIEFRILGTHVYQQPTSGPLSKCWLDYGDSNPAFGGDAPWLHITVAAVTDGRALGFADGRKDAVVVELPAVELLSITSGKLVNSFADQLTGDTVMTKALIELRGGRYANLRFNVDQALDALQSSGIDLLSGFSKLETGSSHAAAEAALKSYLAISQTVTYTYENPVDRDSPPADQLIDASHALEAGAPEPDLCEAAR